MPAEQCLMPLLQVSILLLDDGTPEDLDSELIPGLASLSHTLPFPHSALFQGGEDGVLTYVGYSSKASVPSGFWLYLVSQGPSGKR